MSASKHDQVRQNLLDTDQKISGQTPGEEPQKNKLSEEDYLESREKKIIEELEEASNLGKVQTCRFFFKHSFRDLGRRKCHFCLAFLSVFIVVLSTLVIHSVVAKGPIIFMTLGQQSVGAFDGIYAPASSQEPLEKVNTYS